MATETITEALLRAAINKNEFLFRKNETGKVEEREVGRESERRERQEGKRSRQMLNGACKYRERRDTKGALKRSPVRTGREGG